MRGKKIYSTIFSLLLIFFLFAAGINAQQQQLQASSEPVTPRLQINIPGVSFSQPAQEAGYLNLPFLAEYIIGLSKYLIAIAGVLAGIMLTIGGVQYLMATGNKSAIDAALKRIKGALIGMALVLGSYLILFTINPELVRLRVIKIEQVPTERLSFSELITTTADTRAPDSADKTVVNEGQQLENCPISLSEPATKRDAREPRSREFMQKITLILTGLTPRERVIKTAQAAAACEVHFGACIKTAQTINEAAGLQGLPQGLGRQIQGSISTEQTRWLIALNCRASLLDSQKPAFSSCTGQNLVIPNCPANAKCAAAARAMAVEKFRREIPGWPDSLANQLEPGDSFWVYYGNNGTLAGQHTAVFMGWEGNKAKVVQGSFGHFVNQGAICIKSSCGANIYPITKVFKVQ